MIKTKDKKKETAQTLDRYWLMEDGEKVVEHLNSMTTSWDNWGTNAIRNSWVRNYCSYYSAMIRPTYMNSSMVFMGDQGELVQFSTPIARNYIRQLTSIVTKQRLSFQAMALRSGQDVIADTKLGNALADEIVLSQRLDTKNEILVEQALVMGGAFTRTAWNTAKGRPHIMGEDGRMIMTGAVDIGVFSVFDVFYNPFISNWEDQTCVVVRVLKNRWDLIADFPHLAEKIAALPAYSAGTNNYIWMGNMNLDQDMIYVFEMYCRPSPALPNGRMMMFSDQETIYHDGDNLYKTIPVEPMIPETLLTMCVGYPKLTDLMACQEMFDTTYSSIGTNLSQFGVQSVAIPRGSNIDVNELNGMRFVSFTPQNVPGGGKPEALQLSQSPAEAFKFAEALSGTMQRLSLLNGALTGDLPSGVSSGVAIATLSANALEFINSIAKAYNLCMERTMSHALMAYKEFAHADQEIEMPGRGGRMVNMRFNKSHLQGLSGVKIIIANPLMQTIAGRLEIGEKLLQIPRDKWPMYTSILEGQPLNEIYKGDVSEMDLVYMENDHLMKGQKVQALITDDHALHIKEHAGLLADPDIRNDIAKQQETLQHIMMHEQLAQQLAQQNPLLMSILKTGTMPDAPIGQPGQGQQPGPQGPQGPQGGGQPPQQLIHPPQQPPAVNVPVSIRPEHLGPDKLDNPKVSNIAEPAKDMLHRNA